METYQDMSSEQVMATLLEVLKDTHFDKVKVTLDTFEDNVVFAFTQRGSIERAANMSGIVPALERLGLKNVRVKRHNVPQRKPFSRAPFSDIRVYVPRKDNPSLHQ